MVTLNDGIRRITALADEKEWGNDIAIKIYYAMIELGEAGDIWKHRDDEKYLADIGITREGVPTAVAEELIDTIIYCLHGFSCIGFWDADYLFDMKMKINKERKRIYTDDVQSSFQTTKEKQE